MLISNAPQDKLTKTLPNELIILICEHLAAESVVSLINFCLTSKQYHDLAFPIIYSDVRVKSHYGPQSSLVRFSSRVERYKRNVKTLDIRFTRGHMSAFKTGMASAYTNLVSTIELLPGLSNLSTFIVQLEHHERRNTRLPDAAITSLLEKLPKSVRNLEIATDGLDKVDWDERSRVLPKCHCDSIARLLPQLHHLRVRKGYLCQNIWKTLKNMVTQTMEFRPNVCTWPLRSLVIRLDLESQREDEPMHSSLCMDREAATGTSSMVASLREAVEVGLLPGLEHAVVITRHGPSGNLCTARGAKHSGFAVYDIVRDFYTLVPVMTLEVDIPVPGMGLSPYGDLFLVRTVDGMDRFASWSTLMLALEGNKTFRKIISSAPPAGIILGDLPDRDKITLPKDTRMAIWTRETDSAQKLLFAKRVEGLHSPLPPCIAEDIPPGWKHGTTNKKGELSIVRIGALPSSGRMTLDEYSRHSSLRRSDA